MSPIVKQLSHIQMVYGQDRSQPEPVAGQIQFLQFYPLVSVFIFPFPLSQPRSRSLSPGACLHHYCGFLTALFDPGLSHLHGHPHSFRSPPVYSRIFPSTAWAPSLILKPAVISQCLQDKIPTVRMGCPISPFCFLILFPQALVH